MMQPSENSWFRPTVMLPLIINTLALVWGASQITTTVNGLSATMAKLETTIKTMEREMNQTQINVEVLRAQVQAQTNRR